MKLGKNKFDFFYKRSNELNNYVFEMTKEFVDLLFYNENIEAIKELTKITFENGDVSIKINPKICIDFPGIGEENAIAMSINGVSYDGKYYHDIYIETEEDNYILFRLYEDHFETVHFVFMDFLKVINILKEKVPFNNLLKNL